MDDFRQKRHNPSLISRLRGEQGVFNRAPERVHEPVRQGRGHAHSPRPPGQSPLARRPVGTLTKSLATVYNPKVDSTIMSAVVEHTRRHMGPRPISRRVSLTPPGPEEQIESSFRRFRESAVRLVEQVSDLREAARHSSEAEQSDLHLIRSIFGKWSGDILLALHRTPTAGFEDLRRTLGGISARVLSIKLKELEEIGMVSRQIIDARPPRVRYSLTERGWTVAWLAQPIFLYLRVTETSHSTGNPSPADSSEAATVSGDPAGPAATAPALRSRPPAF
jgi:DNA-binding HxlR family transcriptional regulator